MGLTEFVDECKKVESRLELKKECYQFDERMWFV